MATAVNEILKHSKKPMAGLEAEVIEKMIIEQQKAENQAAIYHAKAQDLRINIQHQLGFNAEDYYRFIGSVL